MKNKLKNFWSQFVYVLDIIKDGVSQIFNLLAVLFVLGLYGLTAFLFVVVSVGSYPTAFWIMTVAAAIMSAGMTWVIWPMVQELFQHICDMAIELKDRKQNL